MSEERQKWSILATFLTFTQYSVNESLKYLQHIRLEKIRAMQVFFKLEHFGPFLAFLGQTTLTKILDISWDNQGRIFENFRPFWYQRSARVSMESRYRHLLTSLDWSQSQHPLNFLVSMSLSLDIQEILQSR